MDSLGGQFRGLFVVLRDYTGSFLHQVLGKPELKKVNDRPIRYAFGYSMGDVGQDRAAGATKKALYGAASTKIAGSGNGLDRTAKYPRGNPAMKGMKMGARKRIIVDLEGWDAS